MGFAHNVENSGVGSGVRNFANGHRVDCEWLTIMSYPTGSNGASQGIIDARILAREIRSHGATPEALKAYEAERRETVNALVLRNRGDGPDKVLDIVEQRAPEGFDDIETVMPLAEREALAAGYKKVAGMDIAALNARGPLLES